MDIHEYQAKKILANFGIRIPRGGIAYSPENAELWKSWLENKSLGALGWGKLDRKTGKKKKLRRRQPTLDDFPEDNGDKKDET